MKRYSLRYSLRTSRLDQLWFPLALWSLFIIIGFIRGLEFITDTTRAYLGAVVPLIAGIMSAYAVLDDYALELCFSTPISAFQILLERLAPIFLVQLFSAISFQVFAYLLHADLSIMGNWWNVQLAWLVPTLSLMALGCSGAIAAAQTLTGAMFVGLVWIVQFVARSWFADNGIGKYFLIFMGSLMPDHPALIANQYSIVALSFALLILGWWLFHRQERYI